MSEEHISADPQVSTGDPSFSGFIRANPRWAIFFGLFFVAAGLLLRSWYPHVDGNNDVNGYIRWGIEEKYGGTRPLGYSHFLVWMHRLAESDSAVFFVQMLVYAAATILQFYTVVFLFRISQRALRWIYFAACCAFFSGLYATNMAMSDSLFYSLTILLLILCLHFIRRPSLPLFAGMLLVMIVCVQLRYLGLIYPALLAATALLALRNRWLILGAIVAAGGTVLMYMNHVRARTEVDQGVRIFSAFGGWQKASNALHIVPYIPLDRPLVEGDDPRVMMVDSVVRLTYPMYKSKYPAPGTVHYEGIWIDSLPLRQAFFYYRRMYPTQWQADWNIVGAAFDDWGSAVIRRYPGVFFQRYLWPNTCRAFFPPLELFEKYIIAGDPGQFTREWFGWRGPIEPRYDGFRRPLATTPYAYLILWCGGLVAAIVLARRYWRERMWRTTEARMVVLMLFFVLLYTAAAIWGSPIVLRFMMPVRTALLMLIPLAAAHLLSMRGPFFVAPKRA